MDIDEIAAAMGKSRLAVRLLLHRGRMNLMKKVRPKPDRASAAAHAAADGGIGIG